MRHFPIFVNMEQARIVMSGGGEAALAKLRLLLKTPARISVFASAPAPELVELARAGRIELLRRALQPEDMAGALLAYAADEDATRDARTAALAAEAGVLANIVDDLNGSAFITPAMVDRDPVCIAIGTEGAAPMLARQIKADLEARLPTTLGPLTRAAQAFRKAVERLPAGRRRRAFWAEFFDRDGPEAFDAGGALALDPALSLLLDRHLTAAAPEGQITLTWTGSDDPDLLTLKARKALDRADVVIHDSAIAPEILELARREARFIALHRHSEVPPMPRLLTAQAAKGAAVLYISATPLSDALIEGCRASGLSVTDIPGLPGNARPQALKETA